MANSESVHEIITKTTTVPYTKQINKLVLHPETYSLKSYPATVTKVSAMLVHAHQHQQEEETRSKTPSTTVSAISTTSNNTAATTLVAGEVRDTLTKSHTCGSLYAKCRCNNGTDAEDNHPRLKRPSNPTISNTQFQQHHQTKRLSSPEIQTIQFLNRHPHVCLTAKHPTTKSNTTAGSKTVVKANVYLNHPEITFPIPITLPQEDCDKFVPKSNSVDYTELKKPQLDYHKYTALAYEKDADEAHKFLQEFGILGPMGNGVTSNLRKNSIDGETIHQIRRNSKHVADIKRRTSAEEYEHLKSIIVRLKKELADVEVKYGTVQTELNETKKDLNCKESEVLKLQREVHKLKVNQFISFSLLSNTILFLCKLATPLENPSTCSRILLLVCYLFYNR